MIESCACAHCGQKIEFDVEHVGAVAPCPTCGKEIILTAQPVAPPLSDAVKNFLAESRTTNSPPIPAAANTPDEVTPTTIKSKTEYAGVGAAIQAAGVLSCFFVFPVGIIVGVILVVIGGRMAIKNFCENCGNRVENKEVKMCAVCHSIFTKAKPRHFPLIFAAAIMIGALMVAFVRVVFVPQQSNLPPKAPVNAPAVNAKMFPALTPEESTNAQQIITGETGMKVTHDNVTDITWYLFNDGYVTSVGLYLGKSPNQTPFLRLNMRYYGDDWIFTKRFLVRADNELLTIEPKEEINHKIGSGCVWETYDEPAEVNLDTVFKIIKSRSCVVRFNGDHSFSDYNVTDGDRERMNEAILVYRYLGGNFEK